MLTKFCTCRALENTKQPPGTPCMVVAWPGPGPCTPCQQCCAVCRDNERTIESTGIVRAQLHVVEEGQCVEGGRKLEPRASALAFHRLWYLAKRACELNRAMPRTNMLLPKCSDR